MHLMILVTNIILVCGAIYVSESKKEPVVLRAVRGRETRLPCGHGQLFLDGPTAYIVWLKNDREFRHRYPNPNPEKRLATRDHIFTTPCESGICPDQTSLLIKKMTERDEGLYRCIMHFQGSSSNDYLIDLKLIESTGFPMIYTGDGLPLKRGFVGPVTVGSELTLVCEVDTKGMKTEMSWHRDGVLVNGAVGSHPGRLLRIDIRLQNLSRGDINARYECSVQNSDVSEPLVASVTVRMSLPPISVEIRVNNNFDFEAGQPRVVDCVVVGCVPPPAVIWHLGTKMVRPSVHKELHDGNYTISSLTLVPSLRDHRKELFCRAYNEFMPDVAFQDKITLNVGYRPTCQVGREERVGAVTGERETVKCVVDASPEPVQFSWTFADSKTVHTSFTKVKGYPNRYTSTLTWLPRDTDMGTLLCRASNTFGDQKKPCIYIISAGGPPELPECKVTKIYPNSLRVRCVKGWDGGRPQMVHLDLVTEDGARIKNVSDKSGHFYLPNIVNKANLTAVSYASNDRGRSKERVTYLHDLPAISEADSNYIQSDWMPYMQAFTGLVVLATTAAIITCCTRILLARRDSEETSLDVVPLPDDMPDDITINIKIDVQYSSSLLPTCRLPGHGPLPHHERCLSKQHSYYV